MVYDITNKQSFEDLKSVWFPEIQQFGEKYKIIAIVGNKSDRYEEENVSESELNSFSKELGGTNFLVSAISLFISSLGGILIAAFIKPGIYILYAQTFAAGSFFGFSLFGL